MKTGIIQQHQTLNVESTISPALPNIVARLATFTFPQSKSDMQVDTGLELKIITLSKLFS